MRFNVMNHLIGEGISNLFKNKKEIESLRTKLIKELTYDHGYSLLRSSKTIQEENDFILQLAKQYDEYGYMSEELGMELDGLFEDKDYVIGIHRTGYNDMDQQMIDNIFNKGLINNGHIMQGGMAGNFDIEKTVSIFPASHFVTNDEKLKISISRIKEELEERLNYFKDNGKLIEEQRLRERCNYDMEMLAETGFCHGIENYSRHIALREEGETPTCLIDFFNNAY